MPVSERLAGADWDGQVLSHDGRLWKPEPFATATAEEFLRARELFVTVHKDARWNPWVLDDHATELERATAVMEQWTRAEPGFTYVIIEELEQRWAREDEDRAVRRAQEDRQRQERQARYDADRCTARLALLELEARLTIKQRNREVRDGTKSPAPSSDRRAVQVAECDAAIASIQAEVDRLRGEVGDPETVTDEHGRLPAERRRELWTMFCAQRDTNVTQLRVEIADLDATLRNTNGRADGADVRKQMAPEKSRLDAWVSVPPVAADEMCADCAQPAAWHRTTSGSLALIGAGPCPAWPQWAARIRRAREMLLTAPQEQEAEVKPAKPQPIAVVPSGLPIGEVISRLTKLQAEQPDAEVRRGRANRWELWPPTPTG